jgi:tetratricopeptide (TPR) repeat protein
MWDQKKTLTSPRSGSPVTLVILIAVLVLPNTEAAAQQNSRDRARIEVVEGARLFQQGEFAAALARFQKAYAIFPSGKVHYNMALAYQGMGKPSQALVALGRFLRDPGDATPELLAESRALAENLKSAVSFVTVFSDVEGAEIVVDGNSVGRTPAGPLPVDPGRHEVILRSAAGTRATTFTAVAPRPVEVKLDFGTGSAPGAPLTAAGPPPRQSDRPLAAAQAEALIGQARDLRRAGKDARAYPLLQKAYELETTPRTAAQLGLVEMQLGYWIAAERHLIESLSAPRDPWIASNRKEIEGSLSRARAAIGDVMVQGTPAGATVSVNGWVAGTLPLQAAIRAGEGPFNLELRADGFAPLTRSLTVVGGRRQEVTVAMTPLAGSAAGPGSLAAGDPAGRALTGSLTGTRSGPEARISPKSRWRPIGWTAAAVGVAGLGFGIYENLQWRRKLEQFQTHEVALSPGQPASTPRECGAADRNRGAQGCDRIYQDMQRAKTMALAGYAAGGLLSVAGFATLLLWSRSQDSAQQVACAPSITMKGGGCLLSF